MLQQHGLGARPYDCSRCGLKFFFRAELDHHETVFHSLREGLSSHDKKIQNEIQSSEQGNEACDKVTVKVEVRQNSEDDDNNTDINNKLVKQEQSSLKLEQSESEKIQTDLAKSEAE